MMSWFMDMLSTFVLLILQNPLGKRCLQQGAVLPGCDERNPDFIFFAVRWDAGGAVSSLFAGTPTAGVFLSASRGLLTGMRENKAPKVSSFGWKYCLLKASYRLCEPGDCRTKRSHGVEALCGVSYTRNLKRRDADELSQQKRAHRPGGEMKWISSFCQLCAWRHF